MGLPGARPRVGHLGVLDVMVYTLVVIAVALADGTATAGLEPGMLSPLAQLTVINGRVERDDMYYFQVLTEAWQSTRVRVSIEDCTPRTALIAAFGAEPTPSRHELLAHAMFDRSGNGTCGVDVISRPSYSRDGAWHFAVVGGSPLHGDRYFAGPPDTLAFEAVVIAESAVYPTLDHGVAASGECLRKVATPPVVVPLITGPPGSSSSRDDGGGQSWRGEFLPTMGRFPAAAKAANGNAAQGGGDEESRPSAVLSPSWLGAFTLSAYDEVVSVPFEVAALVNGKEVAAPGEARRGGRARGDDGVVERRALGENGRGEGGTPASTGEGGKDLRSEGRRQRRGRRRRSPGGLTRGAFKLDERDAEGGVAGEEEEEREEERGGAGQERRLDVGDDGCEVTVCAAAARIPLGYEGEGAVEVDPPAGEDEPQSVCRSVVVKGTGAAVGGVLELPNRPQTGRWYLTARAACDDATGDAGRDRRLRRQRALEAEAGGNPEPELATQDETEEEEEEEEGGKKDDAEGQAGPERDGGRRAGAPGAGEEQGKAQEEKNIYSGSGWGLEVMSLQRDWAHVEWSADFLVPDAGGAGGWEGESEEACSAAAGEEDAFVFRAAAVAEACPRGGVGVGGVDLVPLTHGGHQNEAEAKAPRRFSCVGAELPMLMRRDGAATVREGQPRALSNFVRDEGGVAAAAGFGSSSKEGEGSESEEGGTPRWLWRGPSAPSLWYALEMSGREVGASMEVRLSVNSSAPLVSAGAGVASQQGQGRRGAGGGGSPTGWHMGPDPSPVSAGGGEDAGGGGGGGEGQKATAASSSVYPSLAIEDAASMNLSVAMRVGALPVIDPNGTAREGTVVLWTVDALSEPGEANDQPPYDSDGAAGAAAAADTNPWWSTTFTWNVTHPPPLHPSAVGGGAGLRRGTAATTLFIVVSAETVAEASGRAKRYGGAGAGGAAGGMTRRRRTATAVGAAEDKEMEVGGEGELLWTLGVAPEVTFSYCDEDTCPIGRGECRAARGGSGDDYVTVSKCYCFYGYGGEACAQRVVSYVSMLWQFCLLVLSNLAVVPAVRLSLRLGAAVGAAPAMVLGLNGAASALYHMCDLELTCAGGMLSFHSLQALDFFFSFFSVAALVIHLCPMPWDEPLMPSSSSSPPMMASPAAAAAAAAAAAVAAATPATTALAAASAAAAAADFLSSGGGGGIEDSSSHRRRSRGIPTGVGDENGPLGDGGAGAGVNDGPPAVGLQQVEEETDHLLLLDDNNLEMRRSSSAYGRSRTWNRHQHHGGSGSGSGGGGVGVGVAGSRKGSVSSLSVDGKGSKSHRRWIGGGSGSGGGGGVGGSDGEESLVGRNVGNGKEEPDGGAGSRLASLYVCLIPPLLAGVTDHPTAGANLAVVFAMCGGLLAFSWGRLVARDMREKALAEAVAAERQRWQQQRQERWRAGSVGSTVAAVAALDMDWDEEEGGQGGADVAASAAASAAAAGGGRVSTFNGSNGAGAKHTAACTPPSGWSLREDEEVEQGEEGGQQEDPGEAEGMLLLDRPRGGSSARAGGAQLQRGGGSGSGGGGGGAGDDDDPVGSMPDDAAPSNDFPSSSPAFPDLDRPRARSIGGNRSRRGEQQGAGSGWSTTGSSDRMLDDGAAGHGGSGFSGSDRSEPGSRLGRLRAVLRSLKRVTARQGLLDWRQLGVGAAGFAAGLTCFAVQGSSATAGWYHVWHGAWHVLAMGSAVPLLRARKWGPVESDADENGGLWGCGGSGSPGQGGEQQPQLQRSVRAVGLRASKKRKVGRPTGSSSSLRKQRQQQQQQQQQEQQQGSTATPQRDHHRNPQQYRPLTEQREEEDGEEKKERSAEPGRASRGRGGIIRRVKRPSFVCSSATGLPGLPESRFLSCFLENYAPMCGLADAVSVREGLVNAFVGRWMVNKPSYVKPARQPAEVMRGHALECALFSAMAIGGLALGCPAKDVYRHLNAARMNLTKCQNLREPPVVSALALYGVANALLPPCGGGGGGGDDDGDNDGGRQQQEHIEEYHSSMNSARALYESFRVKDPLMTAFLTYQAMCDNLVGFLRNSGYSVNPANVRGRFDAAVGVEPGGGGSGDLPGVVPGRARVPPTKAAHPSYVVADVMTLVFRNVFADQQTGGNDQSGWRQTHDFIEAELDRLVREKSGAMVITTLVGNLLATKSRLKTTEGMLPIAEIGLPSFLRCPGLLRHFTLHNAHLALTVFKLFGKRDSYDALRDELVSATSNEIATFDDFGVGVHICDTPLCFTTSDVMLMMPTTPLDSDSSGGGPAPAGPSDTALLGNAASRGRAPMLLYSSATSGRTSCTSTSTSTSGDMAPVGNTEEPTLCYSEKVTASPHSDTTPTVAWPEAAWGDSGAVSPSGAAAAVTTVVTGAAKYPVSPVSEDRVDGRQQQIAASSWDERGGGY
eukprot:g12737.t1